MPRTTMPTNLDTMALLVAEMLDRRAGKPAAILEGTFPRVLRRAGVAAVHAETCTAR